MVLGALEMLTMAGIVQVQPAANRLSLPVVEARRTVPDLTVVAICLS